MSVNVHCVVCNAQTVHTLKCSKELNLLTSVIFCMSGAYLTPWLLPYFFPLVLCRKFFELVVAFIGHCSHVLSLTPKFVAVQLFLWPMLSWRREQVRPKLWCVCFGLFLLLVFSLMYYEGMDG